LELVRLIEAGASEAERASRECLRARAPRPRSCPWSLSAETEALILQAREQTNYGPMQLQFLCRRHRSTIYKVLARHGVLRRRRSESRPSTRRYEWAEAGALLHINAFELPKFDRPGHWATGQRGEQLGARHILIPPYTPRWNGKIERFWHTLDSE
jgi:hypothetical protein